MKIAGKWALIIGVILVVLVALFNYNPILFLAAMLVISAVVNRKIPVIKGHFGEWKVNKLLNTLGPSYTAFHDVYVPKGERGTTQIDHIVTSPKGIFVIETKHYNGWIFGKEDQKNWKQVIYKRKHKFLNPIWQNKGHIKALKEYLGLSVEDFHSIISFSSQSTFKFEDEFRSASVLQFPALVRVIKNRDGVRFSEARVEMINQQLEGLLIKDKKEKKRVSKQHVKSIHTNRKEEAQQIKENVCPRCQGALTLKRGKFGAFYGCSGYPECRFTKRDNEVG